MSSVASSASEWRICDRCGGAIPTWMKRHRARRCPDYCELWAGDVRRKVFSALEAYEDDLRSRGVKEPRVRLGAVTAPGVEAGLPWDMSVCAHRGPHRHSGLDGCRVLAEAAALFNERASAWWSELHHEASQAVLRKLGRRPVLLARVWELQKRGVLHVHPLLGYSTPAERAAADLYFRELGRLATAHGFGYLERKRKTMAAKASAAYLSGYFVKGKRNKLSLTETVKSADMPRSIVYVAPWLSQKSGWTMRSLRLKRYLWVQIGPDLLRLLLVHTGLGLVDLYRAVLAEVNVVDLIRGADRARDP